MPHVGHDADDGPRGKEQSALGVADATGIDALQADLDTARSAQRVDDVLEYTLSKPVVVAPGTSTSPRPDRSGR